MLNLSEVFEKNNEEFLRFDRIVNPAHPCPDVCAFLMLHQIAPSFNRGDGKESFMVSYSRHDEITLSTSPDELALNATKDQVIDLIRCGVRYTASSDCFEMFV